ncbi:MAG: hypothetical protein HY785_02650 [Oscillatoriophycideae cyanobacterium NC_groundwater_1537_Pr4_S-0.65um_50_18]|nr:hypothetical protein [Oscillatoriophycideae cyanobacterium NC_groundwater_1537_Pr4_S-0.65um_50_18]
MPALETKALPSTLYRLSQNSSAIAAMASLGVHALMFALLPLLPSAVLDTGEPEIKQSVEVVELTPTEESRLPEISNSLIELPPIAQQPLPSQFNYSLNPLPDPSTLELPPYTGYPSTSTSSDPIRDFLRQYSTAEPLPVSPYPPAPPSTPPAPSQPAIPSSTPTGDRPQPSPSASPNSPQATPSTPSSTAAAQPETSQPQPRSIDEIRQAQTDRIRQRREEISQLATDDTGIGNGAISANLSTWSEVAGAWLDGDAQKFNQINFKEPIEVEAVYPEAACPLQADLPAEQLPWVGVLVDADGKVVNETGKRPQILRGSKYRIFNRQAIEDAIAHRFEATGEKEAYVLQLNYDYKPEACPAQTPSPQPQNSPS